METGQCAAGSRASVPIEMRSGSRERHVFLLLHPRALCQPGQQVCPIRIVVRNCEADVASANRSTGCWRMCEAVRVGS
jgi:hypothetical protein